MTYCSDDANVRSLKPLGALVGLELDLLSFVEVAVPTTGNGAEVHKHVRAAGVLGDEAEALISVEPFHCASCHCDPSFPGRRDPDTWDLGLAHIRAERESHRCRPSCPRAQGYTSFRST